MSTLADWIDLADFFYMGGHGLYVWGSYGVTFAVIALEIGLLALRRRAAGREQT